MLPDSVELAFVHVAVHYRGYAYTLATGIRLVSQIKNPHYCGLFTSAVELLLLGVVGALGVLRVSIVGLSLCLVVLSVGVRCLVGSAVRLLCRIAIVVGGTLLAIRVLLKELSRFLGNLAVVL